MQIEDIAHTCHEANRVLQEVLDEPVSPSWDDASEHIRDSARDGVRNALSGATPEESHENWMQFKLEDGWVHGAKKDENKKTHPCLVPYDQLPPEQKVKDELFLGIVRALEPLLD